MSNKNSWFISHLYLLGFLGFMGLLYFKFYDTTWLTFFAFFGFFGWKWSLKYAKVEKDANFIANENKAYSMGLRLPATIVIFCMFLLQSSLCDSLSVETKYAVLVAGISLGFAICLILYGYLLDKYEKANRNVRLDTELNKKTNDEQLNSNAL